MRFSERDGMADASNIRAGADFPLPSEMRLLPLYGAGFENLGRDGRPINVPTPHPGPDELLCRHIPSELQGALSTFNLVLLAAVAVLATILIVYWLVTRKYTAKKETKSI